MYEAGVYTAALLEAVNKEMGTDYKPEQVWRVANDALKPNAKLGDFGAAAGRTWIPASAVTAKTTKRPPSVLRTLRAARRKRFWKVPFPPPLYDKRRRNSSVNTKEVQKDKLVETVMSLTDEECARVLSVWKAHCNKILEMYGQLVPKNQQKFDDYVAELLKQQEVAV